MECAQMPSSGTAEVLPEEVSLPLPGGEAEALLRECAQLPPDHTDLLGSQALGVEASSPDASRWHDTRVAASATPTRRASRRGKRAGRRGRRGARGRRGVVGPSAEAFDSTGSQALGVEAASPDARRWHDTRVAASAAPARRANRRGGRAGRRGRRGGRRGGRGAHGGHGAVEPSAEALDSRGSQALGVQVMSQDARGRSDAGSAMGATPTERACYRGRRVGRRRRRGAHGGHGAAGPPAEVLDPPGSQALGVQAASQDTRGRSDARCAIGATPTRRACRRRRRAGRRGRRGARDRRRVASRRRQGARGTRSSVGVAPDPSGVAEPKVESIALTSLAKGVSRRLSVAPCSHPCALGEANAIWRVHLYEGALEAY
jgi:hypothetical protein